MLPGLSKLRKTLKNNYTKANDWLELQTEAGNVMGCTCHRASVPSHHTSTRRLGLEGDSHPPSTWLVLINFRKISVDHLFHKVVSVSNNLYCYLAVSPASIHWDKVEVSGLQHWVGIKVQREWIPSSWRPLPEQLFPSPKVLGLNNFSSLYCVLDHFKLCWCRCSEECCKRRMRGKWGVTWLCITNRIIETYHTPISYEEYMLHLWNRL